MGIAKIKTWFIGLLTFVIIGNLFSFALAGEDKKELNHCLIQARIEYENARYENAIDWWNKALAISPGNREALKYVDKAKEKLLNEYGRETVRTPEGEIKTIQAKPSKMKERASKYILEGKKYYCQRMYDWAISEWEKALVVDPGNIEVAEYIERARVRIKKKPASDVKPIETDMLLNPPQPEIPEHVFKKPKKDTLALEDALELGIKNHLPVQIARDQMTLSRLKEKEAFRELFPMATVSWDESSGVVSSRDYKGRKYHLKLKHPLYHGGELRYTWEQAKVNLKIARENYDKTKEDYAMELTKAYYDLVKAQKNFKVQENLLKGMEKYLSMAKREHEVSASTLVEFLNVQSHYNQTYYSYLSSENTLSLARSNFLQLLNLDRDPSVNVQIDTDSLVFKEHDIDLEKCISLAYENRTDLKIGELSFKAAGFGEQVTKSQQLPRIDLTSTLGRAGEAYNPDPIILSNDWFIGAKVNIPWGPNSMNYSYTNEHLSPSLTVFEPTVNEIHSVKFNIFDSLGAYTEAKQSEITKEQAYSDLLKTKQKAASEVREAYFGYQETVIKVKNSLANQELYKKELAIVKEKRSMNEAQTQDIVSSEVKLASEEVNYNSIMVENAVALAKLNKAIGIRNYFK